MTTTTQARLTPITKAERIQIIDVLRGFAIWGILMVNITDMLGPPGGILGRDTFIYLVGEAFVLGLFVNKFYSLFSLLFGLGISIQMMRAEEKGVSFSRLYLRRLLWLFLFGAIHQIFIWDGDILTAYAGFALLALPLRKLRPKVLLIIGIGFITIFTIVNTVIAYFDYQSAEEGTLAFTEEQLASIQANLDIYGQGTYAEVTALRLEHFWLTDVVSEVRDMGQENPLNYLLIPFFPLVMVAESGDILALFLIGMAVGKLKLLHDIEGNLDLWKKLFRWCFPIGLVANVATAVAFVFVDPDVYYWQLVLYDFVFGLAPVFTVGIVAGLVLWSRKATWLNVFAPVGRMALSNYLAHSIIFTTIFYGYGFGQYGSVVGVGSLMLATLTVAIQIVICNWWLKHFRYGPFEWIWRSLTYGKLQSIEIPQKAPATAK